MALQMIRCEGWEWMSPAHDGNAGEGTAQSASARRFISMRSAWQNCMTFGRVPIPAADSVATTQEKAWLSGSGAKRLPPEAPIRKE